MSAGVTRLPVQHKNHPRCPTCNAALPTFDGVTVLLPNDLESKVLCVMFQVKCACGAEWVLKKDANP